MEHPQDKRREEADLLAMVQAYRQEPAMQVLKRLLLLRLAQQDTRLRRCPQPDIGAEQGKAQLLEQLIKEINT